MRKDYESDHVHGIMLHTVVFGNIVQHNADNYNLDHLFWGGSVVLLSWGPNNRTNFFVPHGELHYISCKNMGCSV